MDSTLDALATKLGHVDLESTAGKQTTGADALQTDSTAAKASPRTKPHRKPSTIITHTPNLSADTTSATPQLSPDAPEFVPSPTKSDFASVTATDGWFEVRPVAGKGLGVVAVHDIPVGTRVLCEPSLLRIPASQICYAWDRYQALDQRRKDRFDSLCHLPSKVDELEGVGRIWLITTSRGMSEDEFEKLVKECARVLSTFKANAFNVDSGKCAVFATASRFNHSCVPNVFHTFNTELRAQTLYTIKPIKAGEELTINYMGHDCYYRTHTQRWDWLRQHYEFTCQCEACIDRTGFQDTRRELLGAINWGLQEFAKGAIKASFPDHLQPFIPASQELALEQARDVVEILTSLDLVGPELGIAYRQASEAAYRLQDWQTAHHYAVCEHVLGRDICGDDVDTRLTDQWIEEILKAGGVIDTRHQSQDNQTPWKKKKKKSGKKSPKKNQWSTKNKPAGNDKVDGKHGADEKENRDENGDEKTGAGSSG